MSAPPRYVQRFARVPQALAVLSHHPDGLPVETLARELRVPAPELLEELIAYFVAEAPPSLGYREVGLEFLDAEGSDDIEPAEAARVRLITEDPWEDLGIELLDAATLAPLHRAACDLVALEPDNHDLAAAITRLESTLLDGMEGGPRFGSQTAADLRAAARDECRVHIVYSRFWRPGVIERVVDPYRVVSTRRGFELDAGPLDDQGQIRSYLIPGIRSYAVLDERFERPADVAQRIAAARTPTVVRVRVPHDRRWAVDLLAEGVWVDQSDAGAQVLSVHLLPPLPERIGLLLVLAGPAARVLAPAELAGAGADTARALLAHHGLA